MLSSLNVCFFLESILNLRNCAETYHDHLNRRLGSINSFLNLEYGIPGVYAHK